jgi:predicted Zn-dependent protease
MVEGSLVCVRGATKATHASFATGVFVIAAAVSAALASSGCAAQPSGTYELRPGRGAEVSAARKASSRGDWATAAAQWYAIFQRGGSGADEACLGAARAMCQLGDYTSARGVLEQGLKRHPGQLELLDMHGDVLCRLNFRRAAEACYVEALEVDPDHKATLLALARLRVDLRMECSAIPLLEHRIALGGADAPTYLLLARANAASGHVKESYDAYARSFALDDKDSSALIAAATPYVAERAHHRDPRQEELALRWLERAVEIDPQSTAAHFQLAQLRETRDEQGAAIEHYLRAAETDPSFLPALSQLAELYSRRGESEKAAEIAKLALALEKDATRRAALQHLIDGGGATAKSNAQGR